MLAFGQEIREKERWAGKLDSSVRENWKEEALAQGHTEDQADHVFDEIKYYIPISQDTVEPATVDGTWQADGHIEPFPERSFRQLSIATLKAQQTRTTVLGATTR